MNDMILDVSVLPEPLLNMVRTDKVKVHEAGGVITIMPVGNEEYDCTSEVFGMYTDGKLSVDKFLEQKRADKELEF